MLGQHHRVYVDFRSAFDVACIAHFGCAYVDKTLAKGVSNGLVLAVLDKRFGNGRGFCHVLHDCRHEKQYGNRGFVQYGAGVVRHRSGRLDRQGRRSYVGNRQSDDSVAEIHRYDYLRSVVWIAVQNFDFVQLAPKRQQAILRRCKNRRRVQKHDFVEDHRSDDFAYDQLSYRHRHHGRYEAIHGSRGYFRRPNGH